MVHICPDHVDQTNKTVYFLKLCLHAHVINSISALVYLYIQLYLYVYVKLAMIVRID